MVSQFMTIKTILTWPNDGLHSRVTHPDDKLLIQDFHIPMKWREQFNTLLRSMALQWCNHWTTVIRFVPMPTAPGVAAKSGFYGNRELQQGTSVHLSCDQSIGIVQRDTWQAKLTVNFIHCIETRSSWQSAEFGNEQSCEMITITCKHIQCMAPCTPCAPCMWNFRCQSIKCHSP